MARVESIHYVVTKTICARPRRGGMQAKAVYVVYIYVFFFAILYHLTQSPHERAFVEGFWMFYSSLS